MTDPIRTPERHLSETVPPKFQGLYKRAMAGGRTAAVKCMCLECQGWEDGAVRAVRDCVSVACPLHAVRPYRNREDEEEEESGNGEKAGDGGSEENESESGAVETMDGRAIENRQPSELSIQQKRRIALMKARAARRKGGVTT